MVDISVTNIDVEGIKDSLKEYLKTQDTFKDYNFEGSVMNTILNTLAYNTYLNAYYSNMVANEAHLDTAQIRQNIVSSAKELGYTTRSRKCAVAQVELQFLPSDLPDEIVVPRYTKFTANLDGINYNFITNQEYIIPNSGGFWRKIVNIFEGTSYTYTYTYNGTQEFFKILDEKIDTDTLEVTVRTSIGSTDKVTYTLVDDITTINSESNVYFLQESYDSKYEIYFGDGVLGRALEVGNVVEIRGIVCSGAEPNGIRVFAGNGIAGYNADNLAITYIPNITVVQEAADGQEQETIKNIRFSAPKQYAAQKRLTTVSDYENYLLSNYSDMQSVSVWGGEDNIPPLYGRILVSAKVSNSYVLSNFKKNQIAEEFGKRNMMTVRPIIVDPVFTFIKPSITVYFNSKNTTLDSQGVLTRVSNQIRSYETDVISRFSKAFYLSKFSAMIDATDASIVNNTTTILLEKRFTPPYNSTSTFKIKFNESLKNPYAGYFGCLNSTGFKMANGSQDYFHYFDDDGNGVVRIYRYDGDDRKYINTNVGTIDYTAGEITLTSINFTEIENGAEEVRIYAEPFADVYTPRRNEILLLSAPLVTIIDNSKEIVTSTGIVDVFGNITPIITDSLNDTIIV